MNRMLTLAAVAALAGSAQAAVLFQTDFQSYTTGGQLWAQPGWDAFGDNGFIITDNVGATGNKAVVANTANFSANGSYWNYTNTPKTAAQLAVPGGNIIAAEAKVAILSGGGTRQSYAGLDLYGNLGATFGRIGALRISDSGQFQILSNIGATTTVWSSAANVLPLSTFYTLRIEANFATQRAKYFINGVEVTGGAGYDVFDEDSFSDADLYAVRAAAAAGGGAGGDTLIFDDYKVEQIPTPGALALAALGGAVAARRRRA